MTPVVGALAGGARAALAAECLVQTWFDLLPPRQARLMGRLHGRVHEAAPEAHGAVRWGNLVYSLAGRPLLGITPHRHSVHLLLSQGAALARRFPGLQGVGPGSRTLRLRWGDEPPPWLDDLLGAACALQGAQRVRRGAGPRC